MPGEEAQEKFVFLVPEAGLYIVFHGVGHKFNAKKSISTRQLRLWPLRFKIEGGFQALASAIRPRV